jgi:putative flippase GtrA
MAGTRTQRILERFGRATVVGVVATLTDLGILTLLVEVAGVSEVIANWPSLFVGVTIQFLGAKYAVFKAAGGSWARHVSGFLIAEVGTYVLNGIAFHLLVTLTPVPYVVARLIGTFLVFIGFSYPVWHWVFKDGAALSKEPRNGRKAPADQGPATGAEGAGGH